MGENTEVYERLRNIETTVARIDERTARHDNEHDDHERRIRALERESDRRKGILVAIGTIAGTIGSGLTWIFNCIFGK